MRSPNKLAVIGVAVGLAFTAPGCGGSGSAPEQSGTGSQPTLKPEKGPKVGAPFRGILHCMAKQPNTWETTPSNLSADTIAQALGVPPEEIEEGKWGPAHCDKAIEASQVGTPATVQGIGSKCLAIGLGGRPEPGKTYHDILAVCAEPAGAQA